MENPFQTFGHEATTITGCTKYLAVSKLLLKDYFNTITLLDFKGKVLSTNNDNRDSLSALLNQNPIHKMQFIALKRHIYLAAQNHYSSVSLYLVNPKVKADLHHIRTVEIAGGQYNLPLIPIQSQPGHLIT